MTLLQCFLIDCIFFFFFFLIDCIFFIFFFFQKLCESSCELAGGRSTTTCNDSVIFKRSLYPEISFRNRFKITRNGFRNLAHP